jgi:iron complex transport system permease protein
VRGGLALLLASLLVAALLRVSLGPVSSDGVVALAWGVPSAEILGFRTAGVVGTVLLGASLGLSGLALQILLRNPLASPFVLGVSSGAGFGVACVLLTGYLFASSAGGFLGEALGAAIGALAALAIVARFGRTDEGHDPTALILAGVILGAIFSAATALLEQLVPFGLRGDLLSWTAGRLPEIPSRLQLAILGVAAIGGWLALARRAGALDVSMLSDDEARSSGVRLSALRTELFWIGGLLAAIAVAYAGPIGFVGLVGPHLARLLVGPRHGALVPASALAGAALLVTADVARQWLDLGTGRLPIGVLTALAGGPFFLWLLRRGAWKA